MHCVTEASAVGCQEWANGQSGLTSEPEELPSTAPFPDTNGMLNGMLM